ncbi:MAG: copper homeostasis protein CutC [Fuscovulum sp.]|nr:copper homeostasis protein CutC [Fuscovulum sp.]
MAVTVEVCVDTAAGLAAAVQGGADRIELCSALPLGGLTPSAGFMAQAARCGVPVLAMIRPRAGDFVWSGPEVAQMEADIATARTAGLAGVVLGASLPDGRLDAATLSHLLRVAQGMDCTLHRCFDLVPDPAAALEQAVTLGFSRVLTSGGALRAEDALPALAALIAQAGNRIAILPGSGITATNAAHFTAIGARELHASCSMAVPAPGPAAAMGFGPATERRTDAALVRALRQAVH